MKNGRWRGGVVPYGFVVEELGDEKILVTVESEMKIVKEILIGTVRVEHLIALQRN